MGITKKPLAACITLRGKDCFAMVIPNLYNFSRKAFDAPCLLVYIKRYFLFVIYSILSETTVLC